MNLNEIVEGCEITKEDRIKLGLTFKDAVAGLFLYQKDTERFLLAKITGEDKFLVVLRYNSPPHEYKSR